MPTSRPEDPAKKNKQRRAVDFEAGHSRRTPITYILPPNLQDSVPACARACLVTYINDGYYCPYDSESCLCPRYSSQGFTLGELAYICVHQKCEGSTQQQQSEAYHICSNRPSAVSPTHKRLPLPVTTATTSKTSRTSPVVVPTTKHTTTKSTTHHSTRSATTTGISPATSSATSIVVITTTSTKSASATDTAAYQSAAGTSQASSQHSHSAGLTAAEAAGISIAALGFVMLAIAAIFLCLYLRRRKVKCKEKRESYDFVDEAPPRFTPFNFGLADPRGSLGGFDKRRVESDSVKHMTRWPGARMSYDQYIAGPEKDPAVAPIEQPRNEIVRDSQRHRFPVRPQSAHTKLLTKSPAPSTATTVFEEDREPLVPKVPPRKPLPSSPAPGLAIHYPPPPLLAIPPPSSKQSTTPNPRARQPSLSLSIPKQPASNSNASTIDAFPLPPAKKMSPLPPPSVHSSSARNSAGSVLEYYASPQAGHTASPVADTPSTGLNNTPKRKTGPHGASLLKSSLKPRKDRITSVGSDTSFESVGTDEPTPPEEDDKQLTPVQESPIAAIRYPKVPRSSNQAVPRSPKTKLSPGFRPAPTILQQPTQPAATLGSGQLKPTSQVQPQYQQRPLPPVTPERQATASSETLSGSTLAAKRRGDSAAQDLSNRFYVTNSAYANGGIVPTSKSPPNTNASSGQTLHKNMHPTYRHDSPLKGYGRVASNGRIRPAVSGQPRHYESKDATPEQVVRKSAYWEPKLTPEKRGDDLYLSVGVATPRVDHFQR